MSDKAGWIGVDLDGTLAHYDGWVSPDNIGAPIVPMVERVKKWLRWGRDVRIFTARVWPYSHVEHDRSVLRLLDIPERLDHTRVNEANRAVVAIHDWCVAHIGYPLALTCVKDIHMIELWDDRAIEVLRNVGHPRREMPA